MDSPSKFALFSKSRCYLGYSLNFIMAFVPENPRLPPDEDLSFESSKGQWKATPRSAAVLDNLYRYYQNIGEASAAIRGPKYKCKRNADSIRTRLSD